MIITSEERLKTPSKSVLSLDEGLEIANKLISILEKSNTGIGLSAPQIGIFKQVAVAKNSNGYLKLINPKILKKENPFVNKNEGCLSFPGIWIDTIRYHNITVEDDLNKIQKINNFAAIIVQHEYEHLCGKLFFESKVPDPYQKCFCGSENKFKFCCRNKVR